MQHLESSLSTSDEILRNFNTNTYNLYMHTFKQISTYISTEFIQLHIAIKKLYNICVCSSVKCEF